MSSAKNPSERRQDEMKLDISRRRNARRDNESRLWLENVYESVYLTTYVNAFHPLFEMSVHAFSNLVEEPSKGEWAASEMAQRDAKEKKSMRTLREFAVEMMAKGMLVDKKGSQAKASDPTEELYLKAVG